MTNDPLISTALLGTSRMSAMPSAPDATLEKFWQAIDTENPATAVLDALALTRAFSLAGTESVEFSEELEVSPPEKSESLPAAAVDLAMRLLAGEFPEILPEWMRLASAAKRILPPRVLPELFAMATKNRELRVSAITLAGERGLWIARIFGEFPWLLEGSEAAEGAWEDGSPAERLAWLRQTRADDPSAAAEIIASHWSEEDAPFRESIVRIVSESPHPSDEAWLEEMALKDRRQDTRELGITSLVKLSDSAFRSRAIARVGAHVKIQRRMMKRVIGIESPSAFDPVWAADGIKEKPPRGIGEKAWWLRQIVSLVPLEEFPALLDIPRDDLFALSREKDWQDALVAGWIESAMRFPNRALAGKFIPFLVSLDPWPGGVPGQHQVIQSIVEKLAVDEQYAILDKLAKTLPPTFALDLLARTGSHPPGPSGKAILSVLDDALKEKSTFLTRPQARALAIRIPPEQIQSCLERLAKLPELSTAAEEFATTLEFRRTMISQFQLP